MQYKSQSAEALSPVSFIKMHLVLAELRRSKVKSGRIYLGRHIYSAKYGNPHSAGRNAEIDPITYTAVA